MKTTIPFSGFYYSMWDEALDDEAESANYPDNLDWAKVRFFITRDYTDHFAAKLGIKLDFVELKSPREYNFETDKIVVEIHEDDVARLYRISRDNNKHAELARLIEERCTSRSGFISFYSNDINDWLVDGWITWTSAQLSLLVGAVANIREVSEEEIFEDMQCNGNIHNAFWAGVTS